MQPTPPAFRPAWSTLNVHGGLGASQGPGRWRAGNRGTGLHLRRPRALQDHGGQAKEVGSGQVAAGGARRGRDYDSQNLSFLFPSPSSHGH